MKIRFSKEKSFLFLLLFFWFFSPVISIVGIIKFKTYIVTIIVPAILGFIYYFKYRQQTKLSNLVLVTMLLGFIYVLVAEYIGLLKGIIDFSFTKDYIIGFAVFFSAFYIVMQYKKNYQEDFRKKILLHIFYAGVIHSILIILLAVLPSFKEWFYSFIWITDKQNKYLFDEVFNRRYPGLLSTGFASLSADHATMLSVGVYYLYEFNSKATSISMFTFAFIVTFVSLIFIGRTGFVVLGVYLLSVCLLYAKYIFKNLRMSLSLFRVVFFGLLAVLILLSLVDLTNYKNQIDSSLELLINFNETGKFSTTSTDGILQNHLIFPTGLELLFGTGNFGRGSHVIPSDLGVVYFVNGIGILGTLIVFSFHFVLLFYAYIVRKRYKIMLYFLITFHVLLIVLNFKDLYFVGFGATSKIFFIYVFIYNFILIEQKNKRMVRG